MNSRDRAVSGTLKGTSLRRFHERNATIGVVGLGYVGLSVAAALAKVGHHILGIDQNPTRVMDVNTGCSPIEDVSSAELRALVASGRIRATASVEHLREVDAVIIAVPTPVDDHRVPDLRPIREAVGEVAPLLRVGALVVLESTTYPGTTEEVVVPALRERGLHPGSDVFVGYSPERIDPGNQTWRLANTPKVVAGLTPSCLDLVVALYEGIVERVVPVSTLRTAEMTKLFENIFRVVNIALVNEFQQICRGFNVDVWEVLHACATKPYGFMPFFPGPGLGGHCVPVDPFYLAWKARERGIATEFIELAGRINERQPSHVVDAVIRLLNGQRRSLNGAQVALIGVAYKRNVADLRETPAVRILQLLREAGANMSYHDPHVPMLVVSGEEYYSCDLTAEYIASRDCVVIVTDHDAIDWDLVRRSATTVLDTRNALGRSGVRQSVGAK